MKQKEFNLSLGKHGGRRLGSGRKRIHSKGVAHRKRETVKKNPLHINFKVKHQIRNKLCLRILKKAILNARKQGLRIVHYSLQSNHVHLIAEADNNRILESGMRSLTVTFAMGIGKGKIQMERYHLRVLKALREVKNAVRYVLLNEQKHNHSKKIHVNEFDSLSTLGYGAIKSLIKNERLSLIWRELKIDFLSSHETWLLKRASQF